MAHWKQNNEREDGDNHDETAEQVVNARKWLRQVADQSQNSTIRSMMGDLRQIELIANPFFLGLDYDDDRDDVDEMGPF